MAGLNFKSRFRAEFSAAPLKQFASVSPIVAMTAHAMQRDREKCMQAGMGDYLTKQIEVPALVAVLVK